MGSSGGSSAVVTNFKAVTYTGNGTGQAITGLGFQPDLVIITNLAGSNRYVFDSIRGVTKYIRTDTGDAEATDANSLTAFDSDGFTIGNSATINTNSNNYVAWCFAEVAEFMDIVTYTGTGSAHTEAHDLTIVPQLIILKNTGGGPSWAVKPGSNITADNDTAYELDTTTVNSSAAYWNTTAPTDTVFTVGTDTATNNNPSTFIGYLFGEQPGLLKVDTYTGNGNVSGPSVDLGFVPSAVLIHSEAGTSWRMHDTARGIGDSLSLDTNTANDAGGYIALTANGFQVTTSSTQYNTNSTMYHYIAFK